MTFVERLITVQLVTGTLDRGAPGVNAGHGTPAPPFQGPNNQTGNTLTLSGLRVWAQISQSGPVSSCTAQITIFGMTFSQMMAASTFSKWPDVQNNQQVLVYAGDSDKLSLVFQGVVTDAIADFNAQPDVAFHIRAVTAAGAQATPLSPTSVKGRVNVADLLSALASQCNPPLTFENNSNVQVYLTNPHFDGSAMDQIRSILAAAQINSNGVDKGVLAIWPKGQSRQTTPTIGSTGQTITITPETGLVGYPTLGRGRLMIRCEYNPAIQFGMNITIDGSEIKPANGTWSLGLIEYSLQSKTPNGEWFQFLTMYPPADNTPN